jgi:dissimilatory sulfite reductase (desulfoviridin) alpha/beta subunit
MDLGFQGIVEPKLLEEVCNACGLCISACDEKALTLMNKLPVKDTSKCIYCGDCIKVCPIDAMVEKRKGWLARVGGKHGRHPIYAYEIARFVSDEECFLLIEKTMEWYQANGEGRERIGTVIVRLGLSKYLDEVAKPLGLEIIEKPEDRKKYWSGGNLYA